MNEQHDFLGEGARLGEPPSASLADTAFAFELEAAPWVWSTMGIADLAHVRELVAADIVPQAVGGRLLRDLLTFQADTPLEQVHLDPAVGDVYNNRDVLLQRRFGDDVGRIHTGRARREATTLAWHLTVRRLVVETASAAADLLTALVDTARAHMATVMPDFTYLQHAQPTSLAHYLLGIAYPVARHIEQLREALRLVNRCPGGSGSVNGSRFAIDRDRLAGTLEFDGIIVHTRDAMWAPDIAQTVMAACVATMTTIDRLAEELQIWCTTEFGYVTLADRHCRTSVIMPQKRNPYALAMVRGHARNLVGDLVSVTVSNLTPTGQPDNRAAAYVKVPAACHWVAASAHLMADVMRGATFHDAVMRAHATEDFTYSTDVCDYLVSVSDLDNRSAHRIVGRAVRTAVENGRTHLSVSDLASAAKELSLRLPPVSDDALERLHDPEYLLSLRTGRGGAGALQEMIDELAAAASAGHEEFDSHPALDFEDRFIRELAVSLQE